MTPEYIDYNRRDVLATSELAAKMLEEYERHPIALPVTQAFSPASIGKSYLRAMGIPPVLERQRDFPAAFLGHAQTAFFGGRTSAHIRKGVPVPVVYTDFLSMYPTVNSLMGLWRFVTAREIRVIEHCGEEITRCLRECQADPDRWFTPEAWSRLTAFVCVIPSGDGAQHRPAECRPPTEDIGFESAPAVGQVSISSPHLMRPFKRMNRRKHYQHQVEPFNFLSTCHVRPFGHPCGSTPERFQLIAPYESDSRRWLKIGWIDRYSGETFRIRTTGDHGTRRVARVKTYGDVIEEYKFHPGASVRTRAASRQENKR